MATNYVQEGRLIDYTPSAAVKSGQVVVIGSVVGVAVADIAASAAGAVCIEGVFEIPKATGAITAGAVVYWDADGDPIGGTADSGAATATSTDNTKMGYAIAAAASGDATVKVKLER